MSKEQTIEMAKRLVERAVNKAPIERSEVKALEYGFELHNDGDAYLRQMFDYVVIATNYEG